MTLLQDNAQKAKRGRPLMEVNGLHKALALTKFYPNKKQVPHNVSMKSERRTWKRVKVEELYDSDGVRSDVMMRPKEIQANLAPEFPSIVRCMLPSYVTRVFWMHFPKRFCDEHMPKEETLIVLEDEGGKCYETKYLPHKVGLSAGWRGFSIKHNLMEGDVVIFHLVEPTKFKVYIVRVKGSEEVDGAIALLKLDATDKQTNPINDAIVVTKEMEDQDLEHLALDNIEDSNEKNDMMTCLANLATRSDQSGNESEDRGSEIADGIRLSESVVDFTKVKSFRDFSIIVNGLVIDNELPKHLQTKYYELCSSQKSYLHDHLLEGLNCKLVVGILSETINIADAIRASKLTTAQDSFAAWEKTLKAFQGLGMNVCFLVSRLGELVKLSDKSNRYEEARLEKVNAKAEMRTLEARLLEVKEIMNRLNVKIEELEVSAEKLELLFQEAAKAPW